MALYTKDSIDRVKDAVDMHALVAERTDLRRVGSRWTGLCPFHDERTPSFSVNVEDKLYHCFGCGASGDAIKFVQETQGVDFREAVEQLAERTHVELVREASDPQQEQREAARQRLLSLLTRAAQFYAAYLWKATESEPARRYLAERGLEQSVLEDFQVGYAPASGDKLLQQAAKAGFSAQDLVTAGLARRREGRVEDAFRGRIIFPLADRRGRVLGFAGRALREGQQPKYLNTSENQAVGFHKGELLYALHRARTPAMKAGRFVVVEGYTDVLALHQSGVTESVAIMGTSLTDHQLEELTRVQGTVFLALDADNAGKNATSRASRMAGERQTDLRVVAMPGGRDPADIVTQDGPEAFRKLLDSALNVWAFQLRRHLEQADLSTGDGRQRAFDPALTIIRDAPPLVRSDLIRDAANGLNVEPALIESELDAGRAARRPPAPRPDGETAPDAAHSRPAPPVRPISQVERGERVFLSLCLGLGDRGREYLERSRPEHFATELMRDARQHLLVNTGDPLAGIPPDSQGLAAAVMEIVQLADEGGVAEQALRLSYLQLELRRVERELRSAEQRSDFERQRHLWGERETVRGEISELMGQTA